MDTVRDGHPRFRWLLWVGASERDTKRGRLMDLPVMPPIAPMLAKPAKEIPEAMQYEGKWDGFCAIVFRDGNEVVNVAWAL